MSGAELVEGRRPLGVTHVDRRQAHPARGRGVGDEQADAHGRKQRHHHDELRTQPRPAASSHEAQDDEAGGEAGLQGGPGVGGDTRGGAGDRQQRRPGGGA